MRGGAGIDRSRGARSGLRVFLTPAETAAAVRPVRPTERDLIVDPQHWANSCPSLHLVGTTATTACNPPHIADPPSALRSGGSPAPTRRRCSKALFARPGRNWGFRDMASHGGRHEFSRADMARRQGGGYLPGLVTPVFSTARVRDADPSASPDIRPAGRRTTISAAVLAISSTKWLPVRPPCRPGRPSAFTS